MGKIKTENLDDSQANGDIKVDSTEELSYEEKLNFVSVIAQPMASKKTAGRIYKLIRKAIQQKTPQQKSCVWVGLKNVQTRIRKGDTGIVIFAGDVSPVDLISHLPAVCEEKSIPYIFVPGRRDIGAAMGKNGGALTVLILEHAEYEESFNKVAEDIKKSSKAL